MATQFKGRILALDLGKRRIGIAVSDPLRITAQGLETLERANIRRDLAYFQKLVTGLGVTEIVVGNPIHMGGQEGRGSEIAREFAARLAARTGVKVVLRDERLTTVEAQRVLKESGASTAKRARAVDKLSAMILLESHLDAAALTEDVEFPPE